MSGILLLLVWLNWERWIGGSGSVCETFGRRKEVILGWRKSLNIILRYDLLLGFLVAEEDFECSVLTLELYCGSIIWRGDHRIKLVGDEVSRK